LLVYTKGDFEHPPKWMEYVAKKLPLEQVRIRRDWDRILKFCSAVALWQSFGKRLEPVFASTLHSLRVQEDVIGGVVAKFYKQFQRAVTVQEIAEELGWKKSRVYKPLNNAIKNHFVKYEGGTRERNLKPVLPIGQSAGRFLPSPRSVLKHHPELGEKVKYVDPLSGKLKAVRR